MGEFAQEAQEQISRGLELNELPDSERFASKVPGGLDHVLRAGLTPARRAAMLNAQLGNGPGVIFGDAQAGKSEENSLDALLEGTPVAGARLGGSKLALKKVQPSSTLEYETERRYRADATVMEKVQQQLGFLNTGHVESVFIVDEYIDTVDFLLMQKQGFARIRTKAIGTDVNLGKSTPTWQMKVANGTGITESGSASYREIHGHQSVVEHMMQMGVTEGALTSKGHISATREIFYIETARGKVEVCIDSSIEVNAAGEPIGDWYHGVIEIESTSPNSEDAEKSIDEAEAKLGLADAARDEGKMMNYL